jgi:hypothetical protein
MVLIAAAAITVITSAASAYKIVFPHIHEDMTRQAEACRDAAQLAAPRNCLDYYEGFPALTLKTEGIVVATRDESNDLAIATRWPDDPSLQINAGPSLLYYYADITRRCPAIVARNRNLDAAGLMCSSHYGDLQFMHAQASNGDNADQTRRKILDWAAYAFDVAAGNIRSDASYCRTIRGLESTISAALAPTEFAFCDDRRGRLRSYRGWRVSTFFTLRCRSLFGPAECPEAPDSEAGRLTRLRASGALLHMIQDSFSQSHVRRGRRGRIGAPDTHVSKIVCLPAAEFYDYNLQVAAHEDHAAADLPPSLDPATCVPGSTIHDPITASAMTLWYIGRSGDSGPFVEYVRRHVLG